MVESGETNSGKRLGHPRLLFKDTQIPTGSRPEKWLPITRAFERGKGEESKNNRTRG